MKRDTIVNLVTGAATLVGGGMILLFDPQELSTVSGPGVTVFLCFLVVAVRLLWNWRESRVEEKARKDRKAAQTAGE